MAISKEQPMRPALNDCVDFLNNNLVIGDVEAGITALQARIEALENMPRYKCVSQTVEETNQPMHYLEIVVPIPSNVTFNNIVTCFPSGSMYRIDGSQEQGSIPYFQKAYERFIGYEYDEANHAVKFHWYPTASTSTTAQLYMYVFTGNVIYIERN